MSQNYKPIITILGSLQQTQLKGNMFDIWQEDTYLSLYPSFNKDALFGQGSDWHY